MGSGLILLAIVGAWLAVLVPMALRKYETKLGSVDRFQDAMRVLSRRDAANRTQEQAAAPDDAESADPAPGRVAAARGAVRARWAARAARPKATAAQRRRRLLLTLLLLSLATLLGAVLGPLWLLAPHLLADLLLGGFVVHLRRSAVARAEREWRASMERRPVARPSGAAAARRAAVRRPVSAQAADPAAAPRPVGVAAAAAGPVLRAPAHVAGIPQRMPTRALIGASPAAPVTRPDAVPAARGAQGEAWSPVPVPPPTYLTAPTAPRRTAELLRQGDDAEGLAEAERELGIVDQGPELEEILERRRAVND